MAKTPDGRADWMMRHPVGEATPELEHLRSDAGLEPPERQP
jgi:hypothetical protein